MKAVYYEAFGQPPFVTEVNDPTPSDEGVVIQVEATGLCRSDWHGWMGHDRDIKLPHVPGHELAGTIVANGKNVRTRRVGGAGNRAVRRRLWQLCRMRSAAITRSASGSSSPASPPGDRSPTTSPSISPTPIW